MPPPRSSQDDEGMSSILGFIVGFALLAGSMAAVAYFMITVPEAGTPEESKDLESFVQNAADALTKSPGHPHTWHENECQADSFGLLRAGSTIAQLEKIRCIQSGETNATALLEANDLRNEGLRMYAEGKVIPLASMQAPSTTQYALIKGDFGGDDLGDVTTDTDSTTVLELLAEHDPGFEPEIHAWNWSIENHPENTEHEVLGNTFIDHPWQVHTQMTPAMAGLKATYTMEDIHDHGGDWGDAAMAAAEDYEQNPDITRWNLVIDGEPYPPPGSHPSPYVLTVASCTHHIHCGDSSGSSPAPHWRTIDGMRSFALLPSIDITGVSPSDLTLSFEHLLRVNGDTTDGDREGCHVSYDDPENYEDCVEVRPSIRFWNTTKEAWSRLDPEPSDCEDSTGAWNDTGDEEASGNWASRTVNLCEVPHYTKGELWLGLEWFTECRDSGGAKASCSEVSGNDLSKRSWFITNLEVADDEDTLLELDMKPSAELETIIISQDVDHSLADVFSDDDDSTHLTAPIHNFTERGGNLIAFSPGTQGDFLAPVGLGTVDHNDPSPGDVITLEPERLLLRVPNELPTTHNDYEATSIAWSTTMLDHIQATEQDGIPTLVTGTLSEESGKVTGVAYDIVNMDSDLRDKLLDNIYTGSVLLDPTFQTDGASVPSSATVPVSSAQRIVLAEATETGEHHLPLEVTVYLWPEGLG